jgi:hypothetical protein
VAVSQRGVPRADALPDYYPYRDEGCDLHPACLTCPFEVCRFDLHHGAQELKRRADRARVRALVECGAGVDAVAAALGISRRSAHRRMAEVRR